jgi:hypothetical protein
LPWKALRVGWDLNVSFFAELFDRFKQSNIDPALSPEAPNPLTYRLLQGHFDCLSIVLIRLDDLALAEANGQLHPPVGEGAHDKLMAQPDTHLTS